MMMRTLPAIVALAASARAGDTIKTGRLVGGDLFLCANTQLQHADMLYRVDTATMNVTASLAMPPDADADGWKKMVCGATTAASNTKSSGPSTPSLYEVLDGGGEGNVTLAAAAATLANAAFIADLSGVAAVGDAAVLATGQSCTPAPRAAALAGTPDLPPYCAYKESPKALVARVALADGGNATIGDVRDVAAYKRLRRRRRRRAVEPGGQGGELVVRYDAALEHAGAEVALPVVPMA
ncbi:hypothetical protein SO694_00057177 [Aureococcus anophagefferens]|uniref:Uncharacterized protein n=1 Tax=Aureococcus anophagefferens TaxID=44056 RepID=A0ABR1FX51_AURAN